jgi:hypothetical protein
MPHELSQNGRDVPTSEDRERKNAEGRIQRVLWELEEATGKAVDHVEVDTRNFAQLRTEITLRDGTRA